MITKIEVTQDMHEFIKSEAKKNGRTQKGQVNHMLSRIRNEIEAVEAGKTQLDPLAVVK